MVKANQPIPGYAPSDSEEAPIPKIYYTIGEVAAITKIPVYTLRHWDKLVGKIHRKRRKSQARVFCKEEIDYILYIKELRSLGFSLNSIRILNQTESRIPLPGQQKMA